MGLDHIVSQMNKEMTTNISELFQSVSNPSNPSKFSSTFQVSLPKLFADLRLAKDKTCWSTKMMQAQAMYLCILGFGF